MTISAVRKARKRAKADAALNPPSVVEHAATIMKHFRPTPFGAEGDIVADVRRNRILQGWPFAKADEAARELALAALKKIGWAVRPRDSDAGPISSGNRSCKVCGEEYTYIHVGWKDRYDYLKFCSFQCLHRSQANYKRSQDKIQCEHCDKEFMPFTKARNASVDQRWCSQACYRAARAVNKPEPKQCEECRNTFEPLRPEQRWCSDACYNAARTVLHDPKPCEGCGESFQPKVGQAGERQKFCSIECYRIINPGNPDRNCIVCGEQFSPARGERGRNQRFCGAACYNASRANRFVCEAA